MWKVPEEVLKNTWSVIQYSDVSVIVPTIDSEPHTLEGYSCKCGPTSDIMEGIQHITHNSWIDKEAIDVSLKKIFAN